MESIAFLVCTVDNTRAREPGTVYIERPTLLGGICQIDGIFQSEDWVEG